MIHGLSHPGVKASIKEVSERFVWPGLKKEVGDWARQCISCQKSKVHKHTHSALEPFTVPDRRFDHINVDIVGPLPPSRGYTHLLTVVDRFTRWPEAIPISDTSAQSCARALLLHWVSRYGIPSDMSSDRGPQFTSATWSALANLLGTNLHRTTAYHPQANGLVERFHRHLKASLTARLTSPAWADELPWVLLGIRTTSKEDLGASPAEMVYGAPLTVPGEFLGVANDNLDTSTFLQQLRAKVGSLAPTPTSTHGRATPGRVPRDLKSADFVFVRRDGHHPPLTPKYEGPFKVVHKEPKFYKLQMGDRMESVAIDRLKAAYTDSSQPVQVAQPPKRGRPTKHPARKHEKTSGHSRTAARARKTKKFAGSSISTAGGSGVAPQRVSHI